MNKRFVQFDTKDPQSEEEANEQIRIMERQGFFESQRIPIGRFVVIKMEKAHPIELTPKGQEAVKYINVQL